MNPSQSATGVGVSTPGGRYPPIPGSNSLSISLLLQQLGTKTEVPGSIPPRTVCKPQPHWLVANWLGIMEPARGESCPSGQRRGLAAPGEDAVSSPDQNYFHISATPTNRERKQRPPGSILPRTVWKPQRHWLVTDWPALMEPARGRNCPSGRHTRGG